MLALLTCAQRATYLLGDLLTCTYRAGYVATYLSTHLATYLLACLFDLLLGVRGLSQSQCLTGISTSSFPLPTSPSVCMFDKLYLTLNFKSKVSCDIFTNKNQSQSTYKFHFKMPLQCWVTQYFRKYNVLNNQNTISIYYKQTNKQTNYQSSVSKLWSHMFLQMLKMVVQSIASTPSPQRVTHIRASRVLKLNLLCKWLLTAFCLENLLSQITILV